MKKRKKLGQHFLKSEKITEAIISAAKFTKNDIVLEIGTGKGVLTQLLCKNAKNVISYEYDKKLYENIKDEISYISNLKLKFGDGFKSKEKFSVFISRTISFFVNLAAEIIVSIIFSDFKKCCPSFFRFFIVLRRDSFVSHL